MPKRIFQSAMMISFVLALFLVGNTANAGWFSNIWPFQTQTPNVPTPSAAAQDVVDQAVPVQPAPSVLPTGENGNGQPFDPAQGKPGQPNQPGQPMTQPGGQPPFGQQGNQPFGQPGQQGGQQFGQQGQPFDPAQGKPFGDQGKQQFPGQGQPGQPNQQGGQQDRFFCNSLNREASREECMKADKEKGFQPGQQGQPFDPAQGKPGQPGQQGNQPFGQPGQQGGQQFGQPGQPFDGAQGKPFGNQGQGNNMNQPFTGQGQSNGQMPAVTSTQQTTTVTTQPQQQQQFNFDEQQEKPQFFLDPQFVQQTIREINDQVKELNRLLKAAKKVAGAESAVAQIQELLTKVNDVKSKMKSVQGEDLQELIQEFHDEQIWETLNGIRTKVELPKQLKDMDKSLVRVEKLFKNKSVLRLTEIGLDLGKVKADVASIRETVVNVKNLLAAGNGEDAQEAMQDIWSEGFNPGEIEGVLQQLRGMNDNIRRIRNKDILAMVKEIFQPVTESINDGDYREANQLLNEMQYEMQRIFSQLTKLGAKSKLSDALRTKLDSFDAIIQNKMQKSAPTDAGSDDGGPEEGF